jgi:membrane protein DedA with SNARE-associated domain
VGNAIDTLNEWILGLATSPWVLAAVFFVAWLDGFFPPVPSETLVVAAAAAFASARNWPMEVVLPFVAGAGAVAGDITAYSLGRFLKAGSWPIFRRGKGEAVLHWAERTFARAGGPLIIVARYIPIGRVAVNLTAGSIRFPMRRFLLFDSVAGLTWGTYATAFGAIAGRATDNPLLSVAIGIALALVVGSIVQWLFTRRYGRADQATTDT